MLTNPSTLKEFLGVTCIESHWEDGTLLIINDDFFCIVNIIQTYPTHYSSRLTNRKSIVSYSEAISENLSVL